MWQPCTGQHAAADPPQVPLPSQYSDAAARTMQRQLHTALDGQTCISSFGLSGALRNAGSTFCRQPSTAEDTSLTSTAALQTTAKGRGPYPPAMLSAICMRQHCSCSSPLRSCGTPKHAQGVAGAPTPGLVRRRKAAVETASAYYSAFNCMAIHIQIHRIVLCTPPLETVAHHGDLASADSLPVHSPAQPHACFPRTQSVAASSQYAPVIGTPLCPLGRACGV